VTYFETSQVCCLRRSERESGYEWKVKWGQEVKWGEQQYSGSGKASSTLKPVSRITCKRFFSWLACCSLGSSWKDSGSSGFDGLGNLSFSSCCCIRWNSFRDAGKYSPRHIHDIVRWHVAPDHNTRVVLNNNAPVARVFTNLFLIGHRPKRFWNDRKKLSHFRSEYLKI